MAAGILFFHLAIAFSFFMPGAAAASASYVSKDGQFELTLEDSAKKRPESSTWQSTVKMWRQARGKRELLWSAELFGDPLIRNPIFGRDGSFCIFAHHDRWELFKNGRSIAFAKFHRQYPKDSSLFVSPQPNLLELEDGDNPAVLVWDREDDAWQAFAIGSEKNIEASPVLVAHWNELTRARIRQRIANKEEVQETELEFLAVRRNPEDRAIFDKLLRGEKVVSLAPDDLPQPPRAAWVSVDDPYFFVKEDRARIIGDRLLALFDQKPMQKEVYCHGTQKLFYLGQVSGIVELPTPIRKEAGTMRILVKSEQASASEYLEAALRQQTRDQIDLTDEISFAFSSLPPGKYRVKAIWDRTAPFTDRDRAGAGDYESNWSDPLEVAAAGDAQVILECSRRNGDSSLYAEDERAAMDWKAGALSLWSGDPNGRTELFPGNPSLWILKTNFVAPGKRFDLSRITVLTWPKPPAPPFQGRQLERPVFPPPLIVAWRTGRRDGLNPATLAILDEHGCAFHPQEPSTNRHSAVAQFQGFPRAAETFRLAGYNVTGDLLFDYTVTNHVRVDPKKLQPQPFPIETDIDGLKIQVTGIKLFEPMPNLPGPSRGCMVQATVMDTRNATNAWRVESGFFFDSHGNFIAPVEMCREEKVVGIFARAITGYSPTGGQSKRFEFAVERPKQ